MNKDILSQQEVDALLKSVTSEVDESAPRDVTPLLNVAERELAYWTGVVHALTGKVKAYN